MKNAFFGNTMENVRDRTSLEFIDFSQLQQIIRRRSKSGFKCIVKWYSTFSVSKFDKEQTENGLSRCYISGSNSAKFPNYAHDVFYDKLTKKFHPKEAFRAGKTLQMFGSSGWDKCEHLFSNLRLLLSEIYFGNNVKNSDIALFSGFYVQISDSIEKKYWWICIERTQCQMKNDTSEQSHSAEKSEMGIFWDFQTSIMFQNIKKIEVGPFCTIRKFSKKVS